MPKVNAYCTFMKDMIDKFKREKGKVYSMAEMQGMAGPMWTGELILIIRLF